MHGAGRLQWFAEGRVFLCGRRGFKRLREHVPWVCGALGQGLCREHQEFERCGIWIVFEVLGEPCPLPGWEDWPLK